MLYTVKTAAASLAAVTWVVSVKYQVSSSLFLPEAVYVPHSTPIVLLFLAYGCIYENPEEAPTCQSLSVTSAAW